MKPPKVGRKMIKVMGLLEKMAEAIDMELYFENLDINLKGNTLVFKSHSLPNTHKRK